MNLAMGGGRGGGVGGPTEMHMLGLTTGFYNGTYPLSGQSRCLNYMGQVLRPSAKKPSL